MKDPWGREVFWIGGGTITWTGDADSDHEAVSEGYISVTPLHLDLTNHWLTRDGAGMVAGGVGEATATAATAVPWWRRSSEKGIHDLAVLRAVGTVPRHLLRARERAAPRLRRFGAPDRQRPDDLAAIGAGALLRAARPDRPGAGAGGRHAARDTRRRSWRCSPSRCSAVERLPELAQARAKALEAAGISNVTVIVADGTLGWRPSRPTTPSSWRRARRAAGAPGGAAHTRWTDGDSPWRTRWAGAHPGGASAGGRIRRPIDDVRFVPLLGHSASCPEDRLRLGMDLIRQLIDFFLHLDVHLARSSRSTAPGRT